MRDRITSLAADDRAGNASGTEGEAPRAAGGVAYDLSLGLGDRYRRAHDEVLGVLDSRRYFRLLDALDSLVGSPPWTSLAAEPAREVLPALVRRDWRRVKKRAARVERAATEGQSAQDVELHELRKSSKRLRYACEALAPVFGDSAADLGAAAKQLQDVLGEHQDSVVSQALLRELATHAQLNADSMLMLGRLHLLEQHHADHSRTRFQTAWKQARDKHLRRWLKP